MNLLLSVNNKFFKDQVIGEWVSFWKSVDGNNLIRGAEFFLGVGDNNKVYFNKLLPFLRDAGWKVQIHAPDVRQWENDMMSELIFYNSIAEYMGKEVVVVVHPLGFNGNCSKNDLIEENKKVMNNIVVLISRNNLDIKLAIENLNMIKGFTRLNLDDVKKVLSSVDMGFCWDIGHQVDDGDCDYSLPIFLVERLINIHLHDIDESDHYPFIYGLTDVEKFVSGLKSMGYKEGVVIEVALDYLAGDNYFEKCKNYIDQLEFVANYM